MRVERDLAKPADAILKTLCCDPTTSRLKDVKDGETLPSLYDIMHSKDMKLTFLNDVGQEVTPEERRQRMRKLFYGEADALEDAILFPRRLLE